MRLRIIEILIIAVLLDTRSQHLSTGLVKAGEQVERASFCVEADDVLHDLWVVPPVQRLQVVGCHYVNFLLSGNTCEKHYFLCIAGFQQRSHRLSKTRTEREKKSLISLLLEEAGENLFQAERRYKWTLNQRDINGYRCKQEMNSCRKKHFIQKCKNKRQFGHVVFI